MRSQVFFKLIVFPGYFFSVNYLTYKKCVNFIMLQNILPIGRTIKCNFNCVFNEVFNYILYIKKTCKLHMLNCFTVVLILATVPQKVASERSDLGQLSGSNLNCIAIHGSWRTSASTWESHLVFQKSSLSTNYTYAHYLLMYFFFLFPDFFLWD